MIASDSNARGFFESTAVRDLNEEILAAAGSSWDDFVRLDSDWLRSPEAAEFLDRAVAVLNAEFGKARLFVLKDPRICRLVPFWTAALDRFEAAAKPVLTVRNPLEVASSLHAKKRFSDPTGQMIWLRNVLDAERATRGTARFNTSFEQLMDDWESVARKAGEGLDMAWPKPLQNVEIKVQSFLSDDLRHFRERSRRVAKSALLPEWLRETYEILSRWAETGESANDYERLDHISKEFDAASAAFARVIRGERQIAAQQIQRASEVEAANKAREAELQSIIKDLRDQRDSLKSQLASAARKSDEQRSAGEVRHEALKAQIIAAKAESEQQRNALHAALAEREAIRLSAEARLTSGQEQAARAETERQILQSKVASLQEAVASAESRRASLQSQLAEAESRGESLQSQLAAAETSLREQEAVAEAEREVHAAAIAEVYAGSELLRGELAAVEEALQAQLTAIRELENRTAALESERDALQSSFAQAVADAEEQLASVKSSLQASRREATLLKAEVHQLKEQKEALESELAASQTRRKEAARVIARRDADIRARYEELAALELHILHSSFSGKLKSLSRRFSRSTARAFRVPNRAAAQ
jgi:hypothetical protein